jgi:hypothetical protein
MATTQHTIAPIQIIVIIQVYCIYSMIPATRFFPLIKWTNNSSIIINTVPRKLTNLYLHTHPFLQNTRLLSTTLHHHQTHQHPHYLTYTVYEYCCERSSTEHIQAHRKNFITNASHSSSVSSISPYSPDTQNPTSNVNTHKTHPIMLFTPFPNLMPPKQRQALGKVMVVEIPQKLCILHIVASPYITALPRSFVHRRRNLPCPLYPCLVVDFAAKYIAT